MRTPFSPENARLSKEAHVAAEKDIYPYLFRTDTEHLLFEETIIDTNNPNERYNILDGEQGIDYIVKVSVEKFNFPFSFSFQERFRKADYAWFRDVTITEMNENSGQPSELYKIGAGMFIYGYYDFKEKYFTEVVIINTAKMLLALARKELMYARGHNPRSNQSFITLTFENLAKAKIIECHYSREGLVLLND